jgi:hypothetical protein
MSCTPRAKEGYPAPPRRSRAGFPRSVQAAARGEEHTGFFRIRKVLAKHWAIPFSAPMTLQCLDIPRAAGKPVRRAATA